MKKEIRYICDYCGKLFSLESMCVEHEDKHVRVNKANEMLQRRTNL